MFIFLIAKTCRNNPNVHMVNEQNVMKYFSARKGNGTFVHAVVWMYLKNIMLSEKANHLP